MAAEKTKTQVVLDMIEKGKTRKQILDRLAQMDESISRKSNQGFVSKIISNYQVEISEVEVKKSSKKKK